MYNIRRRQHFPAGKLVVTREEKSSAKRFCFRLKHTASETYAKLQKVYGEDALPHATVFRWFKDFKDGRVLCVKEGGLVLRPLL